MTSRGRLALVLGATTYLAAWAFGSKILYPVALGLPAAQWGLAYALFFDWQVEEVQGYAYAPLRQSVP